MHPLQAWARLVGWFSRGYKRINFSGSFYDPSNFAAMLGFGWKFRSWFGFF
jgi:hypothetical protein